MTIPVVTSIETAREQCCLSAETLWVRYFGNGGMATFAQFESYLNGDAVPDTLQYNVIASALNERFADMDLGQLIPYSDQMEGA